MLGPMLRLCGHLAAIERREDAGQSGTRGLMTGRTVAQIDFLPSAMACGNVMVSAACACCCDLAVACSSPFLAIHASNSSADLATTTTGMKP